MPLKMAMALSVLTEWRLMMMMISVAGTTLVTMGCVFESTSCINLTPIF